MVMEYWESIQRGRGNVLGALQAKGLREQYGDVAIPPEKLPKVKLFSDKQREDLKKEGFLIPYLGGQSVMDLRILGEEFHSFWHKFQPELESVKSIRGEVAINIGSPLLQNSNNKTLSEQEIMVEEFSQKIGAKIPGVKAIIGQVPDYVLIMLQIYEDRKKMLDIETINIRTRTPTYNNDLAYVCNLMDLKGRGVIWLGHSPADGRNDYVGVIPLVVPA